MSDFCKQCSEEIHGKDFGDFSDLVTEEEVKEDRVALVLNAYQKIVQNNMVRKILV